MQCLQLTRGDAPSTEVTVELAGEFSTSKGVSAIINGTKYGSTQTLKVDKGTEVTVTISAGNSTALRESSITLNGTTPSDVETSGVNNRMSYTFAATDNCKITGVNAWSGGYSAEITMPY